MFSHIKFSAIAGGFMVIFVAAFVAFFLGILLLAWARVSDYQLLAASATLMLFTFRMLSFFAAGYLTAQIAITQPLLHAAICGILGSIFVAEMMDNWWLAFAICLPTVIAGAWVCKKNIQQPSSELMPIDIQACTETDWIDLKQIRLQALRDTPTAFGLSYDTAAAYSDAEWQMRAANRTPPVYFIARDDGLAVGLVGGVKTDAQFDLIAMWVAPTHRGHGIGKALIACVLSLAIASGASEVSLFVSPHNLCAVSLYQSMGFRFTSDVEALASFPEITVQRMVLELDSILNIAITETS